MKFFKYPSIPSLTDKAASNYILTDDMWYAFEKIHGANYQLATDGDNVEAYSRNQMVTNDEFFGHKSVYSKYKASVVELWHEMLLDGMIGHGDTLRLFGELAGDDIHSNASYGPLDFYVFDIYINEQQISYTSEEQRDDHFKRVNQLFKSVPFVYAGRFKDVVTQSNKFLTMIDTGSSMCEGLILRSGNKIYKHKNDLFVEKSVNIQDKMYLQYLNENRVRSAVSKDGEFDSKKFKQYIDDITEDVRADMMRDEVDIDIDSKINGYISGLLVKMYKNKD